MCKDCAQDSGRNGNWKGGKTTHNNGYVYIRVGDKYIFEHRLVMQDHIGRDLLPNETVHHKNNIKTDNRIENLELWVSTHPAGARVSDLIDFANSIINRYGDDPTMYDIGHEVNPRVVEISATSFTA